MCEHLKTPVWVNTAFKFEGIRKEKEIIWVSSVELSINLDFYVGKETNRKLNA